MWAAFYANVRARGWRKLGMQRRLSLLGRCVSPIAAHYLSIIPPQAAYAIKLDRLRKRMVSAAMFNTRLVVESWVCFMRRSSREASRWIEDNSQWWSRKWLQRSLSWAAHLERDYARQKSHFVDGVHPDLLSTQFSWAATLYSFHGQE